MRRVVDIDIGGKIYPLCLTLWVYGKICDKYGSMKGCIARLDEVAGEYEPVPDGPQIKMVRAEDTAALIEEYLWLLEMLLRGGEQITSVPGATQPMDYKLPSRAEMDEYLCPGDVPYIQLKVLEAINLGQAREVAAETPKNGEGAGDAQAPEG